MMRWWDMPDEPRLSRVVPRDVCFTCRRSHGRATGAAASGSLPAQCFVQNTLTFLVKLQLRLLPQVNTQESDAILLIAVRQIQTARGATAKLQLLHLMSVMSAAKVTTNLSASSYTYTVHISSHARCPAFSKIASE